MTLPLVGIYLLITITSFATMSALAAEGNALKKRANAVISLMSYTVVPDVTASDLNIETGTSKSNELAITQFGGGATLSETFPVYLEGTLGYSRFDPQFVVSNGNDTRTLPTRWNSLTATGGVGWDFSLYKDKLNGSLVLRPIVNIMLGTMASDVRIGTFVLEKKTDADFQFLDGGRLNAYGAGGALMLDYELFSKAQDIDIELRYSYMNLQTFGNTSHAVSGEANAQNLGIYLRRRAPISDWTLLNKPLRYVLEGARTEYLGEQRGQLGFTSLNSLGLGIELDSSDYNVFVTRTRLVARYMFGSNTTGYGIGMAMSF